MSRKIAFALLLAGVLALVALPAGAHVTRHRDDPDEISGHLGDALYSVEDAEDQEYAAADALKKLGPIAVFFVGDQVGKSIGYLREAQVSTVAAQATGEISSATGDDLLASLTAAVDADNAGLTALGKGDLKSLLDSIGTASTAKEKAEDIIYGYPDDADSIFLGCKLFLQADPAPGETTVGFDNCGTALTEIGIAGGDHLTGVSDETVGSEQLPCVELTWRIICDHAVQPGQEAFISFATPAEKTQNDIYAKAADGRVQVIPFTIGSLQPTADTGAVAKLLWAIARGFRPVSKLEVGSLYDYNLDVTNEGPGAAFDGLLQVTLPSTFLPEYVSEFCIRSGTMLSCPLDNVKPYEGISVSIAGRPTKPGPIFFDWKVTTSAKQTATDKTPNSGTTKATVFAVPSVMIKKISSSIKLGKPGVISGSAASNVKKVQVAVLQVPANPPVYCAWLGKNSKLQKVKPYGGACDKGVWLDVKGSLKWEFNTKLGLPPGSYYVLGRGTSTDGITGTIFKMSNWSLDQFKVK